MKNLRNGENATKWTRIKFLSEEITNKEVCVHLTTELDIDAKAYVSEQGGVINIAINGRLVKTPEDTVKAVSHEIAHVVLGTEDHDDAFRKKWSELFDFMWKKHQE